MRHLTKLIIVALAGAAVWGTPRNGNAFFSAGLDDVDIPDPPDEAPDVEVPDVEVPDVEVPETEAPEVEAGEAEEPAEAESPESETDEQGGGHGGHGADDVEEEDVAGDDTVQSHLNDPMEVARDADGREYVSREVLLLGSLPEIEAAESLGYQIISLVAAGPDGRRLARLLTPRSRSVPLAVAELRTAAPNALVTINDAYRSSQVNARGTRRRVARPEAIVADALVGVIDTGAEAPDGSHPLVAARAFGTAGYAPRQHGSAVVSIISASGARVQVADVFGPSGSGEPYASASAIVTAVRWMIETNVPVINISIEGPSNPIVEAVVSEAARQGHVIVAAAGNGGPLAQPAYPGAYNGVIAVTAVDSNGHAYLRANRGDYVDFAALGVRVPVEAQGDAVSVTGTSFAAPFVAARFALSLHEPSVDEARRVFEELRSSAIDRGEPGRDPIYGWGEIRGQ